MHSDRAGSQLCSQNCCWSSVSAFRHKIYMTQNTPCPGGKKSIFLLICLSIASNIPFSPAAFQRQIMNTAMCWGRRPWLLTWKVMSEKIKYLPWVTSWSRLQNQILSHINSLTHPHEVPRFHARFQIISWLRLPKATHGKLICWYWESLLHLLQLLKTKL